MLPQRQLSLLLLETNRDNVLLRWVFQCAKKGFDVWYIVPKPIDQLPSELKCTDKDMLKCITFLYLNNTRELIRQLNCIHLWYKKPQIIVVDRFEDYVKLNDSTQDSQTFLVLATLADAISYCKRKRDNQNVHMLISYVGNNPNIQLFRHYFGGILDCSKINSNEDLIDKIFEYFSIN